MWTGTELDSAFHGWTDLGPADVQPTTQGSWTLGLPLGLVRIELSHLVVDATPGSWEAVIYFYPNKSYRYSVPSLVQVLGNAFSATPSEPHFQGNTRTRSSRCPMTITNTCRSTPGGLMDTGFLMPSMQPMVREMPSFLVTNQPWFRLYFCRGFSPRHYHSKEHICIVSVHWLPFLVSISCLSESRLSESKSNKWLLPSRCSCFQGRERLMGSTNSIQFPSCSQCHLVCSELPVSPSVTPVRGGREGPAWQMKS